MDRINEVFEPSAFLLVIGLILLYERPVRRFLSINERQHTAPEALLTKARQRALNDPFFLIAADNKVVRQNASSGAGVILDAIIGSLEEFRQGASAADDVTLVVAKVQG